MGKKKKKNKFFQQQNQQNNQNFKPEQVDSSELWDDEKEKPQVEWEAPKEVIDTKLEGEKVIAFEKKDLVYEPGFYGKEIGDRLELSMCEACLLTKRGRIKIFDEEKEMTFEEIYNYACSLDKRFAHKFRVYEDLRERGLVVRTGFKFGCDFRVYERGVQLKKGPKSAKEHTKWIVFAVPEDFTMSFAELSRSVRLAHNIRAKMLWAVVDNESDVTFYMITRHKP